MKKNITLAVDEQVCHAARIWAAEHNASLSAVVEYCLTNLPRLPVAKNAAEHIACHRQKMPRGVAAVAGAIRHYIEEDRAEREQEGEREAMGARG